MVTEEKYPEPVAEVGSVGDPGNRRASWRVSVHEGRFGPKIDVRRWFAEPRPEEVRAYVPKGKGRGRIQKAPFVGATKAGARFDLADALELARLIFEAADIAERHEPETPYEGAAPAGASAELVAVMQEARREAIA